MSSRIEQALGPESMKYVSDYAKLIGVFVRHSEIDALIKWKRAREAEDSKYTEEQIGVFPVSNICKAPLDPVAPLAEELEDIAQKQSEGGPAKLNPYQRERFIFLRQLVRTGRVHEGIAVEAYVAPNEK